eukprot:2890174-Ditylum_brightwellii.AAC.1
MQDISKVARETLEKKNLPITRRRHGLRSDRTLERKRIMCEGIYASLDEEEEEKCSDLQIQGMQDLSV